MYVCMYVHMCVCMYIYTYAHVNAILTFSWEQAMLAEHVRDPSMTWSDAREKLRQDERYSLPLCDYVYAYIRM